MAELVIATEGCCKGHLCDNCQACQRGHCCRKDNPQYHLPELGSWSGQVYGELGVRIEKDGELRCHACGEWFERLDFHVFRAHDLTAREYRAVFGLNLRNGLVPSHVRKKQEIAMRQRIALGIVPRGGHLPTPEQNSARFKGRKPSPENMKHLMASERRITAWKTQGSAISKAKKGKPVRLSEEAERRRVEHSRRSNTRRWRDNGFRKQMALAVSQANAKLVTVKCWVCDRDVQVTSATARGRLKYVACSESCVSKLPREVQISARARLARQIIA